MKRINEEFLQAVVMAPKSVAANTPVSTEYVVDVSNIPEVAFTVATGALGEGKKLTVQLLASDASDGSGAEVVSEAVFLSANAATASLTSVSYEPTALHGRYVSIKLQHDADNAVICSVTAILRQREIPANNVWTMMV